MKKILLGLFALSAMAIGATNPGDDKAAAEAKNHKYGEVGVEMQVRAEILPAEDRLILVDENNRKIEKLEFDHKQLVKSPTTPDSVVKKTVKLMLESGNSLGNGYAKFIAKQGGVDVSTKQNKFVLNKYNSIDSKQLESELTYLQSVVHTDEHMKEIETEVISTIRSEKIANADTGLYIGDGTFEAFIATTEENLKTAK